MAPAFKMPRKTAEALDVVRSVERGEAEAPELAILEAGLRHRSGHVVARAAKRVLEQEHSSLEQAVAMALVRLLERGVDADPGCSAKATLAEALDLFEHLDPEPFVRGARHRQLEASWGPPVDTATGLRVRCGDALARLWSFDALPLLAGLLSDPEPAVRRGSCRAIERAGGPGAVALLSHKILTGDPDRHEAPDIIGEAMASLLALDSRAGLELGRRVLEAGPREPARHHGPDRGAVAVALGEARLDAALPLLAGWFEEVDEPRAQELAVTAIAVLRTEAARDWLLARVASGEGRAATAAVRALEIYRWQEGTEQAARRAASRNPHLDLAPVLDEVFND